MNDHPKRETPDEWATRMVRVHGPVPMRIGKRLAHLRKQQQAKKANGIQNDTRTPHE